MNFTLYVQFQDGFYAIRMGFFFFYQPKISRLDVYNFFLCLITTQGLLSKAGFHTRNEIDNMPSVRRITHTVSNQWFYAL